MKVKNVTRVKRVIAMMAMIGARGKQEEGIMKRRKQERRQKKGMRYERYRTE